MNYTGKSFVSAALVAALAIAVASCSGVERAYVQIDADRAEIVVPAGASPVVSFAAEEMSGVLKVGGKGEFGWGRNFKGRFVDVMPEREMDEVRRWTGKLGHKIWMWTYPSKYGEKAAPGVHIWRNIYTPAVLKQQVGHLMGFVLSRAVGEAWMDCMALEELGQAVGGK